MQTTTTLKFKDSKSGTSARGPWKLNIFEGGDGRDYTTLKGDVASKVMANDGALFTVEFSERQNGKFTNYSLDDAEVAPEGAKPQAAPSANGGGKGGEFRSPAQIIRTSALESAVQSFYAAQLDPVADKVGVLETAAVYEAYITEGIEEEPEA